MLAINVGRVAGSVLTGRLHLGKGQLVNIIGRLQTRQWEDDSKIRHWKTEIVTNSVEMLSGKPKKDYAAEFGGRGLLIVAPRNLATAMRSFKDVDDYLDDAWAELHATNAILSWFFGRPAFDAHKAVPWSLYAFDGGEIAKVGKRSREWTAVAPTEIAVVRSMARCLREICEGRVPR